MGCRSLQRVVEGGGTVSVNRTGFVAQRFSGPVAPPRFRLVVLQPALGGVVEISHKVCELFWYFCTQFQCVAMDGML